MARKLRIQFPGAIYHVINRGNYRRDLFLSPAEAQAFLAALREVQSLMGWRVHAYALMRNHYHLALETPEPNLVEGMHWLQTTWATRFNRFRQERGHLFQGRYQSVLIEDAASLGRVVDYIHLNPVRAKIVPPEQVRHYRWTSLPDLLKGPSWIDDAGWQAGGRFTADLAGRLAYERHLITAGGDEAGWEARGLKDLSRGWAIGTTGWRQALAREFGRLTLTAGMERANVRELRESRWEAALTEQLVEMKRTEADLATKPMKQPWKLTLAAKVRAQSGAPVVWLAERLQLGAASSVRSYLCQRESAQ
ncbi:MAG: transposase [Candidatus Didemnitutus sp.]|nr:transposase [Candidatus Didemnitutus sp.]